ncbi:14949_t:CDS:2 [Cetraspora pellucida]|uniref:14949_t:CDS:1 n=1 Tax=Cetraspora pellucida TaxID=1433469 RepID=A0A9N9B0D9_9GLOM|nr:14949_t:CDS:2 [Cetraspora pellucida]
MPSICTLYSESTDAKNFQRHGYKLDTTQRRIKELKSKNINLTEYKAKYYSKLEEVNLFQFRIKLLKEELSLTQKYSSKKDSEIMTLKAELLNIKVELDSKISELECLKSEDILVSVVDGDSEKNISKSRPKGQYFAHKKIMNEVEKISTNILTHTNDKIVLILESSKINTEVTSKISDETIINENNKGRSEKLSIIALGASIVNKYQTTPIKQIFHSTLPSHSLNSKLDYTHSMTASEKRVMDSQFIMQKNSKTGLPPMKLFLIDIDEVMKHASLHCIGYLAMLWSFAKLVTGKSNTGKTNILGNLVLGDKAEYIYKKKKGRSSYIQCDDLIVCGYHPNEPKYAFIRYIYGIIASNPRASYYENIRFSYILPKKIPSIKFFLPERSTVIIFEDLYVAPNSFSQYVSKIVSQYTNDVKSASMVINSYFCKSEFIVFDLNRAEDDPLAIQLKFNTPLDLQKEIELHQKYKTKNALSTELMNSEPKKSVM